MTDYFDYTSSENLYESLQNLILIYARFGSDSLDKSITPNKTRREFKAFKRACADLSRALHLNPGDVFITVKTCYIAALQAYMLDDESELIKHEQPN